MAPFGVDLDMDSKRKDIIWTTGVLLFFTSVWVGVAIGISKVGSSSGLDINCVRSISAWKDALEEVKDKTGAYPEDDNLADAKGLELVIAELYSGTNAPSDFLSLRDPWGEPYRYRKLSRHRYQLGSTGPDRMVGRSKGGVVRFGDGDDITIDNGRL